MKYGYEGVSLSDIVEEYHILNNRIVIKYLDGGIKSIEYTPENEQNTLNLMLEQAIRRNELYFYQNDKDIYEKSLTYESCATSQLFTLLETK